MTIEKPQLRSVEIVPVTQGERVFFVLRDPIGYATGMVTVPPPVAWLFQFFNGTRSRGQIQEEFKRQFNQVLPDKQLDQIIDSLDKALMLESDNFRQHVERITREFREAPSRPSSHAGLSYPDSPDELRNQLEGFYLHEKGPGALPDFSDGQDAREIKAIVSPHIDLRSGGPCFAHAYHALARAPRPDLFVILGTGHAGLDHLFAATRKAFESPLGTLTTDADFIDRLAARFGPELFEGELLHRNEHVIEFQTIFLRHLYGGADIKIAPILCSYAFQQLDETASPDTARTIRRFSEALGETIRETAGRVCVIASIDLAHIGPRYGDESPVSDEQLEANTLADKKLIERLAACDADGFAGLIRDEQDARHICGFPCLNTMLHAIDADSGQEIKYDVTAVDDNGSYVSFASMIFH